MSKDNQRPSRRDMLLGGAAGLAAGTLGSVHMAQAQTAPAPAPAAPQARPNILVIFGDDIGWSNISAYNMGMMGYRTPNI
ncbi:MAG: arylsulfatase, partial [Alphaproteobacteria bacterium]